MSIFGSSWLEETPYEEDGGIMGHWRDETSYTYYQGDDGEYYKVNNMREFHDNHDKNNLYSFDGEKYQIKNT